MSFYPHISVENHNQPKCIVVNPNANYMSTIKFLNIGSSIIVEEKTEKL